MSAALKRQMLEWIAARPRDYADVMEAWRTSCPRLAIWEDACADRLIAYEAGTGRIILSDSGKAFLGGRESAQVFRTTDLYDRFGEAARILPPVFRDFGGRSAFTGAVVTVRCFEDNSRLREVVATEGAGRVLVVDGGGSVRCALMGDMLGAAAMQNHWAGVVIYGSVRDSAALARLDLGVRALGVTPRRSSRRNEGESQVDLEIDGVSCRPGDVLFADEDGVLLLDATQARELEAP